MRLTITGKMLPAAVRTALLMLLCLFDRAVGHRRLGRARPGHDGRGLPGHAGRRQRGLRRQVRSAGRRWRGVESRQLLRRHEPTRLKGQLETTTKK